MERGSNPKAMDFTGQSARVLYDFSAASLSEITVAKGTHILIERGSSCDDFYLVLEPSTGQRGLIQADFIQRIAETPQAAVGPTPTVSATAAAAAAAMAADEPPPPIAPVAASAAAGGRPVSGDMFRRRPKSLSAAAETPIASNPVASRSSLSSSAALRLSASASAASFASASKKMAGSASKSASKLIRRMSMGRHRSGDGEGQGKDAVHADSAVIFAGMLTKRAQKSRINWKDREFRLRRNSLDYFDKSGKQKGSFRLDQTTKIENCDDFAHALKVTNDQDTLVVKADSIVAKQAWLSNITRTIAIHASAIESDAPAGSDDTLFVAAAAASSLSPGSRQGVRLGRTLCKVLYDFTAAEGSNEELTVAEGDVVEVVETAEAADGGWVFCKRGANVGLVPASYLSLREGSVRQRALSTLRDQRKQIQTLLSSKSLSSKTQAKAVQNFMKAMREGTLAGATSDI